MLNIIPNKYVGSRFFDKIFEISLIGFNDDNDDVFKLVVVIGNYN